MTRSEVEPMEGRTNDRDAARHEDRTMNDDVALRAGAHRIRKGDASMAYGLIGVVTKDRIEAAVERTLRLHAQQDGEPLGSLAWEVVEETFRTGVMGVEDVFEHHLAAIHAALVADVVRLAERRLGEPSQEEPRSHGVLRFHPLCVPLFRAGPTA